MIGRVELAHALAQPRVAKLNWILYLEIGGVSENRHPRYGYQQQEFRSVGAENVMGKTCSLYGLRGLQNL